MKTTQTTAITERKRLTYKEAAQALGCGVRTLQRYVADDKIPDNVIYRLPGKLYFWEDELDKLIQNGGIK